MKAAVYTGIGQIEIWKGVEKPVVQENEALLRVESCAVCGSDIRILHHGNDRVVPPQILGHEIAGQIVEVGKAVKKFKVGDRVAVGADIPCGSCKYCEEGIGNNCLQNYAMGYQFAGGFAEFCLLNEMVLNYGPVHQIPESVSYDAAALAEPLGCVINGLEMVRIRLGDTLVIIGAGPIGCMMIPIARIMGAARIILIDKEKVRIENAKQFGADQYICSNTADPIREVMRITNGYGADVIITANASAETHLDAIRMAGHRARINLFGGLASGTSITLEPNEIHYKEISVMGSHGSTPRQHKMALDLIGSRKIDMEKYISHRLPLQNINEAFELAENKSGMRVVVKPNMGVLV